MEVVILLVIVVFLFLFLVLPSLRVIGPTEVGLVIKRFGVGNLKEDNPVAFHGEPGIQSELLMPGWRWKFWINHKVEKYPWVQVPAGEIGVIVAQVGKPLPIGSKSAPYNKSAGLEQFGSIKTFVNGGGYKGVQRPVLPPGAIVPIHPAGFLVITRTQVFGQPIGENAERVAKMGRVPATFNLTPDQLRVTVIDPNLFEDKGSAHGRKVTDVIGIVTVGEGDPLQGGDIAGRLGAFDDLEKADKEGANNTQLMELLLSNKNTLHNNYQDFQAFLDNGGKMGLQHDPLLYGTYTLNPYLISVEIVPMLVVEQGEVAVIKAYVGRPSEDTSGTDFKFGSLVKPGHKGIWAESLKTGKYPINPHCYQSEIVPTAILTLNWADATSKAHSLDAGLQQIVAKSREGFIFKIDLQVQIHIAESKASKVISMVGTMSNLVSEVLQPAVGNHFRDRLQSMPAVSFIETRQKVQEEATSHITDKLNIYQVETKGVYIQDVILPEQLVTVLTAREIANQEVETLKKQQIAQTQRVETEKAKGMADKQADLAKAEVEIKIKENLAKARKNEAEGEAAYISQTGMARGAEVEAVGMAKAKAYKAQSDALAGSGGEATAMINMVGALSDKQLKFVPDVMISGNGSGDGNAISALAGMFTKRLLREEKDASEAKDEKKNEPKKSNKVL